MKRFDLRHLSDNCLNRMCEIIKDDLQIDESGIFLFEVGDFSNVSKSKKLVAENGWEMMNSLRFNEVDWMIVVKKCNSDNVNARNLTDSTLTDSTIESNKLTDSTFADSTQSDSQ